jgi:NYN domain
VDRCALFVDAGYVLGDGAMAVHGTRNRDSVSWDYAGILRVLGNVARDRTGLPLLRCYWYEATVEGRRTPEHEALADLPGVKLRLGRMRPGRREGVESEIHRDLTTLARNRAISDALIVSAEEDLAQVISDVQDLGIRVILVHIPAAGSWTVSPALRQECDDLVEISAAHLRPAVELVVGAEPVVDEDRHAVSAYAGRAPANGHGPPGVLTNRQALPVGAHAAPPAIYTGPVIAEYQRAAQPTISQPAPAAHPSGAAAAPPAAAQPGPAIPPMAPAQPGPVPQPQAVAQPVMPPGVPGQPAGQAPVPAAMQPVPGLPQQSQPGPRIGGHHAAPAPAQPDSAIPVSHGHHALAQQAVPPAQPGAPATAQHFQPPGPVAGPLGPQPVPGMAAYEAAPPAPAGFRGQGPDLATGPAPTGTRPAPPPAPPGQVPGAPAGQPVPGAIVQPGQQFRGAPRPYQPGAPGPAGPPDPRAAQQFQADPGAYVPQQGPPSGPQPAAQHAPVPQPVAVSLADAVQAAHGEGFNFGQAVARDAPALWLEAVLARKPRMPSDLEARLLQDSSLPIDSLLHDEVRHALRRGFWDALERVRH